MIRYALICEHDHDFEGWFRDSATCDDQLAGGAVECPFCGSHAVAKALMAPNVVSSRSKESRADPSAALPPPSQDGDGGSASRPSSASAPFSPSTTAPDAQAPSAAVPALPMGQASPSLPVASGPEGKEALTQLAQAVAKLRAHVEATCEDVGGNFAEEARKIHHGEADERPIHGEATLEEAKALNEEGIGISVLPWSRRVQN